MLPSFRKSGGLERQIWIWGEVLRQETIFGPGVHLEPVLPDARPTSTECREELQNQRNIYTRYR